MSPRRLFMAPLRARDASSWRRFEDARLDGDRLTKVVQGRAVTSFQLVSRPPANTDSGADFVQHGCVVSVQFRFSNVPAVAVGRVLSNAVVFRFQLQIHHAATAYGNERSVTCDSRVPSMTAAAIRGRSPPSPRNMTRISR